MLLTTNPLLALRIRQDLRSRHAMATGVLTQLTFLCVYEPLFTCRASPIMKVETCAFSQRKIYPGRGKLYVRGDSKVSVGRG